MQALILAAGMGNRLGKHTKENTKCMLEINGKKLIDYVLDMLNNIEINKLVLVVGYKKENLMSHLGNKYKNVEIEYIENPIYDKTNNIYSLFLAKEKLAEDDTILLESDLMFEEKILKRLVEDTRKSLAVVDKYQAWMDGTSAVLDDDDNILNFFPKNLFRFQDVDSYFKTVNIYKFSKEFSTKTYIPFLEAYSKAMGDNEYYESVLRILTILGDVELKAMRLNGEKWYEIDDIQDKENAEVIFSTTAKEKLTLIQKRYGGYWRFPELKDFCYLVNPYFPPQKMQEEMKAYFYDLLSQYPSGQNTQNLLAAKMFNLDKEDIIVGNGAAEIIKAMAKIIEGKFGIVFPTFNEYPEAIGYERVVEFIPNNRAYSYEIKDLVQLAEKCDTLILINPDNPSGNFIKKDEIIRLAEILKQMNKRLIVDESFVDFAKDGLSQTVLDEEVLEKYKNLIVIKSISKSYGVPGIRLGILATKQENFISKIKEELSIWNINSFGEFFLQSIGKYKNEYKSACIEIAQQRDDFYKELCKISYLNVIPSQANYFLCEVTDRFTSTSLAEILLDKYEIYIKDLSGKIGFKDKEYIRIAVRDKKDNATLIKKLKEL